MVNIKDGAWGHINRDIDSEVMSLKLSTNPSMSGSQARVLSICPEAVCYKYKYEFTAFTRNGKSWANGYTEEEAWYNLEKRLEQQGDLNAV